MLDENETHWMDEEYGIPHKNGRVRFYVIGVDEDVSHYLGWFNMTDWDKGWKKVWKAAVKAVGGEDEVPFQVLRHDQLLDLANNVHWAMEEALKVEGETTFWWWYSKKQTKGELK